MEAVKAWVVSVSAATMIVAVLNAIAPKNSAGKVIGFTGAVIIMSVLLSPVKSLDSDMLKDYSDKYGAELERKMEDVSEEKEKLINDNIEQGINAYILQRAESIGVSCDVSVSCVDGLPHTVSVWTDSGGKNESLSEVISAECGIPKERQTYKVRERERNAD